MRSESGSESENENEIKNENGNICSYSGKIYIGIEVNIFSATRTVRLCGKPTDHNLCLRSSKSAHNLRRVENVIYTPE